MNGDSFLLLALLIMASLHITNGQLYRCPGGLPRSKYLRVFRNKCYWFEHSETTWDRALGECKTHRGTLVNIFDWNTQKWIMSSMNRLNWRRNGVWIGARDYVEKNLWRWTTGEKLNWNNWDKKKGQPNCSIFGCFETCAQIRRDRYGMWHDHRCGGGGDYYSYICMYLCTFSETMRCTGHDAVRRDFKQILRQNATLTDTRCDGEGLRQSIVYTNRTFSVCVEHLDKFAMNPRSTTTTTTTKRPTTTMTTTTTTRLTTGPTTRPTTGPTTRPTTRPTTNPTTIHTTKPTKKQTTRVTTSSQTAWSTKIRNKGIHSVKARQERLEIDEEETEKHMIIGIVMGVLGTLLLVIVLFIVIIFFKRRKNRSDDQLGGFGNPVYASAARNPPAVVYRRDTSERPIMENEANEKLEDTDDTDTGSRADYLHVNHVELLNESFDYAGNSLGCKESGYAHCSDFDEPPEKIYEEIDDLKLVIKSSENDSDNDSECSAGEAKGSNLYVDMNNVCVNNDTYTG